MADDKAPVGTVTLKNEKVASSLAQVLRALEPDRRAVATEIWSGVPAVAAHAYQGCSAKIAEANRQIERIRPYLNWASEDINAKVDRKSLNQTIGLLNLLTTTPSPIPMLSIDHEGFASFYLSCDGSSISAIVGNDKVEYLFSQDPDNDQFHEEDIEAGRIPPNLLYFLYSKFAKNAHIPEVS